jgi:hypothetical protein
MDLMTDALLSHFSDEERELVERGPPRLLLRAWERRSLGLGLFAGHWV